MLFFAVNFCPRNFCKETCFKSVAHFFNARIFFGHVFKGQLARLSERHNAGCVFRATSAGVFLMAADDEGLKFYASFDVEKANAFWCVEFVAGDR